MKWSWKLGRVAGIDINVHATFLILVAWVAASRYFAGGDVLAALTSVFFILAVFLLVVLHELGHALTAGRFGISTRDITLLPIGGVARLERMPDEPRHELLVALAGPAVNLVLALPLYLGMVLSRSSFALESAEPTGGSFLANLFWVNIALAAFNLLPAFPLDGGRALRALLAMRTDDVRATDIAARLGKGMAFVFGAIGLFFNPILVVIAIFVWLGASQEAAAARFKAALEGVPVRHAMVTELRTLAPHEPLSRALHQALASGQRDFPVVDSGRFVGMLTRAGLLESLRVNGADAPVGGAMQWQAVAAEPAEPLASAVARLQECGCHTLPVLDGDHLAGVLTPKTVREYLAAQTAIRASPRGMAAWGMRDV